MLFLFLILNINYVKQIKDYINKQVAIYCSSREEWDKINKLCGYKGLTREYGAISDPDNKFVDCIHINGKGTACKTHYEKESYIVYPASDFLEEWIPKVGDWAYRLVDGSSANKVTKDKVYEVLDNSDEKRIRIIDDSGYIDSFDTNKFRKALSHEIPIKNACQEIPKYVKCIKNLSNQKIGDIEKTSEVPKWTNGWSKENFWNTYYLGNDKYYEPSTESEYLAQEGIKVHEKIIQYLLTKNECTIDLKNTKIWIGDNPELSSKIQKKLLSLGYYWVGNGNKYVEKYDKDHYFWINSRSKLERKSNDMTNKKSFESLNCREIFPSDLGIKDEINMFINQEIPLKFPSDYLTQSMYIKGNYAWNIYDGKSLKAKETLTELELPKPMKIIKRREKLLLNK
jgi:ribosomal protein S8